MATLMILAGFFCILGKATTLTALCLAVWVGINYKTKVIEYVNEEKEAEIRAREAEKGLHENMQAYSEAPTVTAWKGFDSNY